jgi:hypothetical protein
MSTFSTNLYIELIGTGEQTGTWGGTTNNTLVYAIEEPIVGRDSVAFTDANVTLTPVSLNTNQIFRNLYLNCTGTNTTTRSLIVPTINKNYYIENNTNQSLLVKTAAGTGVTVLSGYICAVYINGTDVIQAANYQPVMTVGTLSLTNSLTTAYGGTGLASYTAGDTLYYSSGTVLSKLGIGATGTVLTVAGGVPTWAAVPTQVASFNAGTTGFTPNTATTGAVTLSGTLIAANGGTGLASVGTSGNVLTSNGSAWTSSPSFVSGMIMLWSGAIVNIPTGWLICDGTNSTPDLRDRFVVGAGTTYAVNATGGSANAVVPSHTHTATDSGHTHTQTGYTSAVPQNNGSNQYPVITPISLTTGTGFANITVSTTGVSPTNANLPPYLALAYIMKS